MSETNINYPLIKLAVIVERSKYRLHDELWSEHMNQYTDEQKKSDWYNMKFRIFLVLFHLIPFAISL
jgi:hypothetical protein